MKAVLTVGPKVHVETTQNKTKTHASIRFLHSTCNICSVFTTSELSLRLPTNMYRAAWSVGDGEDTLGQLVEN